MAWTVITALSFFSFSGSALADDVMKNLKARFEKGAAAERILSARRDEELSKLMSSGLSQAEMQIKADAVLNTYRAESSKLVAVYRQPLIEHLKEKFPGLKDSAGTPLYAKHPDGRYVEGPDGGKVIHHKFRGWTGDHDLQGSATQSAKLQKYLNDNGFATTGFGSANLKDLTPGDVSAKDLELTVNLDPTNQHIRTQLQNKDLSAEDRARLEARLEASIQEDSMLKPGDSAHQTVANVAAQGKETYVAMSMKHDQPGFQAVMVNDHYKKTVEGLGLRGDALLARENRDAFQGMVKGTDKALDDSGLSPADIDATLKKHGVNMPQHEYRALLANLKVKPYPGLYGLDAAKADALRQVSQDLLDQSVQKTLKSASSEVFLQQKKISELDLRIQSETDIAEKQKLAALRDRMAGEVVDTRVKLQAVLAANDARREKYGLPPRTSVPEANDLNLTPETAPASKHAMLKAKSDAKIAASSALAKAGKSMELFGIYESMMRHIDDVASTSAPEDSDVALVLEITKRSVMDATGFTEAADVMQGELGLMRAAMQNIDKGNYFAGLMQWNTAMVKGMGRLAWQKMNDAVITPLTDAGVAVYEAGYLVYDTVQNNDRNARNAEEQARQQAVIAQKKEMQAPVVAAAQEPAPEIVPETPSQAAPEPIPAPAPPVAEVVPVPELTPEPMPEPEPLVDANDMQIDPNAVAQEQMIDTSPLTDPYPVAEERMILDPSAQATDTMQTTTFYEAPAYEEMLQPTSVHDEPMIDNDYSMTDSDYPMEETIVPYEGGNAMVEDTPPEVSPIWQSLLGGNAVKTGYQGTTTDLSGNESRESGCPSLLFGNDDNLRIIYHQDGCIKSAIPGNTVLMSPISICGKTYYIQGNANFDSINTNMYSAIMKSGGRYKVWENDTKKTIDECPAHKV